MCRRAEKRTNDCDLRWEEELMGAIKRWLHNTRAKSYDRVERNASKMGWPTVELEASRLARMERRAAEGDRTTSAFSCDIA
jgi:hypothetical protein